MLKLKLVLSYNFWLVPLVLCTLLILIAQQNMVLFHSLAEGFAIIITILTFVVAFNTYPYAKLHYLLFIGCGYLCIALLDFAHTISIFDFTQAYAGNKNHSLLYWLTARFIEAWVLIAFPFFINKALSANKTLFAFGVIFSISIFLIFCDWLPQTFIPGQGLTQFKVVSEYVIIILLLLALANLTRFKTSFSNINFALIFFSIVLTILAELCFTLYQSFESTPVVLGHILKLLSYWCIYYALIKATLQQPFKALSLSSQTFDSLPDAICLIDHTGKVLHANQSANKQYHATKLIRGKHIHQLFHADNISQQDCPICRSIEQLAPIHFQELCLSEKHWVEITVSDMQQTGEQPLFLHVSRDISDRKLQQQQFLTVNKLYTVLRLTNRAIIESNNKDQLLQEVCNIAVKHGGFSMAWIGIIGENAVIPVCSAGNSEPYLSEIRVRLDDSELSKGPVGTCAIKKQVTFVNNFDADSSFAPWRDKAKSFGFASIAAVPVIQHQECIAIFAIYANEINAFNSQTIELLKTLANDISRILRHIEQEDLRFKAEQKAYQLSQAIEQSKNAIMIVKSSGVIEYINPYYTTLIGYKPHQLVHKNIHKLPDDIPCIDMLKQHWQQISSKKQIVAEMLSTCANKKTFWAQYNLSTIVDEQQEITHILCTAKDHSELHQAQQTIEQLAYYDPLTELPNRRLYQDRFNQALQLAKRNNQKLALVYIDLDNFKGINDTLGHDFGDLLLQHVAKILSSHVRHTDTVARLGGDEFSIIFTDIQNNEDIAHICQKIINSLNQPVELKGKTLVTETSIGISLFPQDAHNMQDLMKHADMAMYHAKAEGKNNYQFYDSFLNVNAHYRQKMEESIRQAMKNNSFELYFQPQIDLVSKKLAGVEALLRWHDPEQGFISPADFIPIAEQSSLIVELDNWVIHQVCLQFNQLLKQGLSPIKVAVNISARQFHQPQALLATIISALDQSCFPSNLLQLEITEGCLVEDIDQTLDFIEQLQQRNISFAIDDFGTGYSSLSYLKQLPVNVIKIDRSFIGDIVDDANDRAIIRAIHGMAKELELKVLAEGVENEQQLAFLTELGCDYIQGYYFDKPMPANDLMAKYSSKYSK